MEQAKQGDTVKVHYTGKLADDAVFDSSRDREPLEFTIGAGQIISGFEQAVVGMQPGENKITTIPADQAYGSYQEEMVIEIGRDQFPPGLSPEVGQQLRLSQPDGSPMIVTVMDVSGPQVTLDANHPLAGQDLVFDIQLVEIS